MNFDYSSLDQLGSAIWEDEILLYIEDLKFSCSYSRDRRFWIISPDRYISDKSPDSALVGCSSSCPSGCSATLNSIEVRFFSGAGLLSSTIYKKESLRRTKILKSFDLASVT